MEFTGPNGMKVRTKTEDLLGVRSLGYRYDTMPDRVPAQGFFVGPFAAVAAANLQARVAAARGREELRPTANRVRAGAAFAELPKELRAAVDRQTAPNPPEDVAVRLVIEDMVVDPKVAFGVRVYLNSPDPTKARGPEDPHFVGDVFFFALGHRGPDHAHGGKKDGGKQDGVSVSAALPLSPALQRLGDQARGKPLDIQCVPVAIREGRAPNGEVRFRTFRVEAVGLAEDGPKK
jgi:hypothetical protein